MFPIVERTVADWEELREQRLAEYNKQKAAAEKLRMQSMGMTKKKYQDMLKSRKLEDWC